MHFHIQPSTLCGQLTIPSSKSHTLRALLFAWMGKGQSVIQSPLLCQDFDAMCRAIETFGAQVEMRGDSLVVQGNRVGKAATLDVGNSGLVLRLMGAMAALSPHPVLLTGDATLCLQRPVQPIIEGICQLGGNAKALHGNGRAPLHIQGSIQPGRVRITGRDSQPVSALLIATSFLKGRSEIFVEDPGEKPWIDLTLFWCNSLGLRIEHTDYEHYVVHGYGSYEGFARRMPGDWSSAAFPLAAALITKSSIVLDNLDQEDSQGDRVLLSLLQQMGARIVVEPQRLIVSSTAKLQGITVDMDACIDALPILAVLGCYATTPTRLMNAQSARTKESDRLYAISLELKKMGAQIEELSDGLIIYPSTLKGARLSSHADHRIAMALCVAALGAQGSSYVENAQCIAKTYPGFVQAMQSLGANIEQLDLVRV